MQEFLARRRSAWARSESQDTCVPRTPIGRSVKGRTALTMDAAMRLSTFCGNTPESSLNLPRSHDLAGAREPVDVSEIVPLVAPECGRGDSCRGGGSRGALTCGDGSAQEGSGKSGAIIRTSPRAFGDRGRSRWVKIP